MAILKHPDPITGEWIPLSSQGSVYVHTYAGTVHNFQGAGVMGIVYLTEDFTAGDTFTVNGVAVTLSNTRDLEITFKSGRWMLFLVVGSLLTFIQDYGVVRYDTLMSLTEGEKVFVCSSIGAMPDGVVSSNLLINGGFDIWQRGTSQTAGGYASDDRWVNHHNASTKSHSRQEFTVGQTDVPNNPKYYSRTVVASAGTSGAYVFKMQSIEDVTRLGGKIVTLSLWAKADASKNISLEMLQIFGSGGSADVQGIGVAKLALTTSWQMLTVTFALPSISGKTVGANSHTGLRIWFESGSDLAGLSGSLGNQSGTFDIANVQLNYGSVALPFVPRSYADELRLCQRYAVVPSSDSNIDGRMLYYTANSMAFFLPLPVTPRTNPTLIGAENAGFKIINLPGTNIYSGFVYGCAASPSGMTVTATKTAHGYTDAMLRITGTTGGVDMEL